MPRERNSDVHSVVVNHRSDVLSGLKHVVLRGGGVWAVSVWGGR